MSTWSPDGEWIAFDSGVEGADWDQVLVIHPDGSDQRVITSFEDGSGSWAPQWSPDGSELLFQHGANGPDQMDLWISAADGSRLEQLTHDPGRYGSYDWGP